MFTKTSFSTLAQSLILKSDVRINTDLALQGLYDSIKRSGLLSPLVLCEEVNGKFSIIQGNRRVVALMQLLKEGNDIEVGYIVKKASKSEAIAEQLTVDKETQKLNALDKGFAFQTLSKQGVDKKTIGALTGHTEGALRNMQRVAQLPIEIRSLVESNTITATHGLKLSFLKDKTKLSGIVEKVILEELSVKQTEELVRMSNQNLTESDIAFQNQQCEELANIFAALCNVESVTVSHKGISIPKCDIGMVLERMQAMMQGLTKKEEKKEETQETTLAC